MENSHQHDRAATLAGMELVMGKLPAGSGEEPPELRIVSSRGTDAVELQEVAYRAEGEDWVTAYLLRPSRAETVAPGVLCLHQTTKVGKAEPAGVAGLENLHYALELAERGYVCLAPDYPGFGGYAPDTCELGYVSTTMKGIFNHMRGIDLLQSLPEVDSARIGCIGHSLGGHNTLFVAAFDRRIAVSVTSCGFTSFAKYKGGDLTAWAQQKYMPRIRERYGCDPKRMPFDFSDVLRAIAPRAVFVNAPLGDDNFEQSGVHDCLDTAIETFSSAGSADRLRGMFPDCGHDFPAEARAAAYGFIDEVLG